MKSKSHILPADSYYIGDPCYVIPNEDWDTLLASTGHFCNEDIDGNTITPDNWDDGVFTYRGLRCFAYGTAYGDGTYQDKTGQDYWVDSGLLSIIPVRVCTGDMAGGNQFKFTEPVEVYYDDGIFTFGPVVINTEDEEDPDDDEDWDFEDEEDDDNE